MEIAAWILISSKNAITELAQYRANEQSRMDYEKILSCVIQLVEDAGELLIAEWQRPNGPRGSGDKAEVDIEIESMLKPGLLQLLDCDFWGEEIGYRLTGAQNCWVVDPNDRTADFLNSYKGSAISVGLLEDSQWQEGR